MAANAASDVLRERKLPHRDRDGDFSPLSRAMVQVPNPAVRAAIVKTATAVFSSEGYDRATVTMIAEKARVAVGTLYTYFPSKLHLLYAVYRPWMEARMAEVEEASKAARGPRAKVKSIVLGLWREAPKKNPGLANSLMQALASADPADGKIEPMLRWNEGRISEMLARALPSSRRRFADDLVANIVLMAYDGYVINRRLGDLRDYDKLADIMADLLLGRD